MADRRYFLSAVGFLSLYRIGLDVVPGGSDHNIAEGEICDFCNFEKLLLIIRGDPDRHYPIASFWHGEEGRGTTEDCKISLGVGRSTTYLVWNDFWK